MVVDKHVLMEYLHVKFCDCATQQNVAFEACYQVVPKTVTLGIVIS